MMTRPLLAGLMLAAAALPLAAQEADDAAPHEGRWAIVAVADDGHCEETYRLPIDVEDGAVSYAGWFGVEADGRIDTAGNLTMTLEQGGDVVNVAGRLGAKSGTGKWDSPGCAGTWQAEKTS